MKKILLGFLLALATGLAGIGAAAYQGWIDVAADAPHEPLVFEAIAWARERAIARRLDGIVPPQDFSAEERIRLGAGNYEAMCAECHLRPGMANSEIRQGLYPQPPALTARVDNDIAHPARRFWITKHGIMASGMPAWGKGGMTDDDIWNLVAFLDHLPGLTAKQYRSLQASSPGHSHGGQAMHEPDQKDKQQQGHAHTHDRPHAH